MTTRVTSKRKIWPRGMEVIVLAVTLAALARGYSDGIGSIPHLNV